MERAIMGSIARGFLDRGRLEGAVHGRRVGRIEGEARTLIRQLERRFGPIDWATRERIGRASVGELDAWADRVLYADRVADVFEPS